VVQLIKTDKAAERIEISSPDPDPCDDPDEARVIRRLAGSARGVHQMVR